MGFFRKITEKPWLVEETNIVEMDTAYFLAHNRRVALILFLSVVTVLFGLLIAAYHMRLTYSTDWVATPEPPLLWINTAVLILTSVVFEWTRSAVRQRTTTGDANVNSEDSRGVLTAVLGENQVRSRFLLAGIGTVAFLILQLVVWFQLIELGYVLEGNPANAFFYTITALHGLHLLGGLIAWVRGWNRTELTSDPREQRICIEQCAIYWHFLLFVWVVMLGLFIST